MSSPRREIAVRATWVLADACCWIIAILATLYTRLDLDEHVLAASNTWVVALAAAAMHIVVGILFGPYMVRHVRGSFEEVISVGRAAAISGLALIGVAFFVDSVFLPRSAPILSTALAIVLMLAVRFTVRSWRTRRAARNTEAERVLIYGAGLAGRRLVHNLLHDDRSKLVPVAFLDDDRHKRKLKVEGVSVVGNREDMAKAAERFGASQVLVAIPHAESDLLREVQEMAKDAELAVKVLPPVDQWGKLSQPEGADLRDLNLEDLLGRRAIELDQSAISDHLTGKVVLVTGAGGSIGAELCRQISKFAPARLVMLDRDESALHATQLSIAGRALLDQDHLLLADIRDRETVLSAFAEIQPDVVFHAAALKHLSLLERYPTEAWHTNVLGTLHVLEAAAAAGVGTFVNVSTDKAASPTSVLGESKRVAERLTSHFAEQEMGRYVSVRFGNVLGSRGSVIPAFTEQIRRGGPVTVTHPDVERYFMLIPEACQLVMQAGAIGHDGQVMVLDMGQPIKILDVAQDLIRLSGRHDVQIQFTGLRPGEKLSEVLFTEGEEHLQTGHPLIAAVRVPPLGPTDAHLHVLHSKAEARQSLRVHGGGRGAQPFHNAGVSV